MVYRDLTGGLCALLLLSTAGCVRSVEGVPDGPTVAMRTSMGDFTIVTYASQAPITTDNFVQYAEDGFYDGSDGAGATVFHRIVPGFVVQGGGMTPEDVAKETRGPIVNEAPESRLSNYRGTVAMARTSSPDSATSGFFVNLVDNGFLDSGIVESGYAVFGEVTEGMDVIDRMAAVPLAGEMPLEPIVVESVTVTP